jgi:CBS domain containing-hemolysin-like protein
VIALAIVLLLIAGSGFYSGMETAVVSVRRARLERLAADDRRARTALRLLEDTPRTIASILVGNNLCNIGAASIATALAVQYWPENGPAIATALLTPVVLVAAEIFPKAFFRTRPTRSLCAAGGALQVSAAVVSPLVVLTSATVRAALRLLGIRDTEKRPVFARQDLENLFMFGAVDDESPGAGPRTSDRTALRMAGRALDLRKRTISHAMVPFPSERSCPGTETVREAKERFRAVRGRYLAALDPEGRIMGFVAAKALLGEPDDRPLEEIVHPALLLDLDDSLDTVLQGFRTHQPAIGLVRDAEGNTLGVVTAEDVFGEVVGELTRLTSAPRSASETAEEKR